MRKMKKMIKKIQNNQRIKIKIKMLKKKPRQKSRIKIKLKMTKNRLNKIKTNSLMKIYFKSILYIQNPVKENEFV